MYESNCLLQMSQNGISFQGPLICDGQLRRFSRDGKGNPDEWCVAYSGFSHSGQPYTYCIYGSWSDGSKFEYKSWEEFSNKVCYSLIDRKELQSKIEESRRLAKIEQQRQHEEAAKKAKTIWGSSSSVESHPYLKEKRVQAYGIRINDNSSLLIPIRNIDGEIRSVQFIYQESGKFEKRFLAGGEKQGHFHLIGEIHEESLICISEGYATGASWHEATLYPTIIAFDSGNLSAVTQAIQSRYPLHRILIVGDDDIGSKINVGRQKAMHAAEANNCLCIFPEFKSQHCDSKGKYFTDFNDLHISHGLEEIRLQLKTMIAKQEAVQAYQSFKDLDRLIDQTNGFEDLTGYVWKAFSANKEHLKSSEIKRLSKKIANKAGISIQDLEQDEGEGNDINHRSIALAVITSFGYGNLVESLGKIWRWNEGGLWEQIDDRLIKRKIHELMDNKNMTKFSVESVLDITKTEIFMSNHQFDVDTQAINCLNGELHFRKGTWHLEPHDKQNYRTTQIPILYNPEASASRFEQFLDEVFQGDEDAEEKKAHERRYTKLACLQNNIAVPHILVKLLLRPVQVEEGFIASLINDPVKIVKPP